MIDPRLAPTLGDSGRDALDRFATHALLGQHEHLHGRLDSTVTLDSAQLPEREPAGSAR